MISTEIIIDDVIPALRGVVDELDTVASQAALDSDNEIEILAFEALDALQILQGVVRKRVSS